MRIACYIAIMCLLQSCFFFSHTQEKQLKKIESMKPFDVIIIPGLPLYNGKWDTLLKSRILWSDYLYKNGFAKNILYSGNAVYTKWKEGPSMALYAEQLGIRKENIFIDTLAEHSTENLFYGYQLAREKGFKSIAIATDPFQCIMLKKYAKKHFKEPIYFFPVIYDSIRSRMIIQLEIDSLITQKRNFIPLENRQDYKERLSGTRGKHIKTE
jgi:uncharacterized SAM-binding protein YcdF (DUF218 family)